MQRAGDEFGLKVLMQTSDRSTSNRCSATNSQPIVDFRRFPFTAENFLSCNMRFVSYFSSFDGENPKKLKGKSKIAIF